MTPAKPKQHARRRRGSIDAEMILRGAFEVARRDGVDGMSMPNLAAHLKVGVTSIYWYYRNKDELLQQMRATSSQKLADTLPRVEEFTPEDWRQYLCQFFEQLRATYAEDDVMAELMLNRLTGVTPRSFHSAYTRIDSSLAYLVSAGFSPVTAWDVYSTLWSFAHSVATGERCRRQTEFPPEGDAQVALLDVAAMPLLTQLITEEGISLDFTGTTFAAGLQMILDSAAARLLIEPPDWTAATKEVPSP